MTEDDVESIIRVAERVLSSVTRQLADIAASARWFTTLVVAEMAWLSNSILETSGWGFGISIASLVFLAFSITLLIIAVLYCHSSSHELEKIVSKFINTIVSADPAEGEKDDLKKGLPIIMKLFDAAGMNSNPRFAIRSGLFLFWVGTILAGIAILIT